MDQDEVATRGNLLRCCVGACTVIGLYTVIVACLDNYTVARLAEMVVNAVIYFKRTCT